MRHRNQTVSGRHKSTPQPPINPPERDHVGDHRIHPEDAVYDHDGPSVKQQENADSPIIHVITEHTACVRDGCDAAVTTDYLYTMAGMSDRLEAAVRGAVRRKEHGSWADDASNEELMYEYIATSIEVVDYSDGPILGVRIGNDVMGYLTHDDTDERSTAGGKCYGDVDEATRLGI